MEKKPQISSTYDDMFEQGGFDQVFDLPYQSSCYYPMYHAVLKVLQNKKVENVLEVGCGSGAFAHMLFEKTHIGYRGFDFSPVAVEKARHRTSKENVFYVADALNTGNYATLSSAIICTEVLEHIPNDLELVSMWPAGTFCVCSVPNFDSTYHERFFRSEAEVAERYGRLLDIKTIKRIKKPTLSDISRSNFFRQLRWNRYRPKRLKELLGFGNFDEVGGWFIFTGYRIEEK